MQYNKTTGKIFEDDPNVRIPQKDLVNQIQKEQDQKEIYPSDFVLRTYKWQKWTQPIKINGKDTEFFSGTNFS